VAENNPALGVNCFRPDDHGEFDQQMWSWCKIVLEI
jgi:hypothetical protein